LIAARVLPTVLGAWLDREELGRAVGSTAGRGAAERRGERLG
jgi:hypothetical protein